jgi:hypothetical protein
MTSVVDRHRFDADTDSDPTLHVDVDPDPDIDWLQNDGDPHANPTPSFTPVQKKDFFYLYSYQSQFTMIFFSHEWQRCHDFKYFKQHIEIFWRKI